MTDNELDILKINTEARARGLSYGQFVSRSTAADLEKITGRRYVPPVKEGKKRRRIRHV